MTLHIYRDFIQGSAEWHQARRGLLTASVIGTLITPSTKAVANNDKARGLVAAIVAERITEWEDPEWGNADMDRGHQVEPIARDWYTAHTGRAVEQVGFMVLEKPMPWDSDDLVRSVDEEVPTWRLGFSPDGLVGDDGLIEVKAPRAKKHVLTHVSQDVPAEHMAQCQTGMFVSGRSWCDFISYVGGEAPFLKRVEADPDWFTAIEKAAKHFEVKAAEMADAYKKVTADLPRTDRLPTVSDLGLVF